MSDSKWIEIVWKRECDSEYCSVKREVKQTLPEYGMEVTFNEKGVTINGASMTGPWKTCGRKLKHEVMKGMNKTKRLSILRRKCRAMSFRTRMWNVVNGLNVI